MRLAVWDFNGIVVDDVEAHRKSVNVIFAMFGVPPLASTDDSRRHTTVPFIHGFEAVGITRDAFMARQPEIDRVYHDTYMAMDEAYQLRRGVRDSLTWVNDNGGRNIILTNTRRDVIDRQLDHMNIRDHFAWISTADDRKDLVANLNKTQRLKHYFGTLGSAINGVIIGDSTEEPVVAREFGLKSVAVCGGWFDRERLVAAQPDHLVECVSDVPRALAQTWNIKPAF